MKTCGFPLFIKVFYSLAVSFLSVYVYTPSGRRTTISALNPFAPAAAFRHNRIKNERHCVKHSVSLSL